MGIKRFFKDYLEYYPSEKRGAFYLAFLVVLWTAGLYVYAHWPVQVVEDKAFETAVREYYESIDRAGRSAAPLKGEQATAAVQHFSFDPNTIGFDSLRLLGVPESPARAIISYRKSGGRFRKPEDLSRIYTLSDDDFMRLRAHIRIATTSDSGSEHSSARRLQADSSFQVVAADTSRASWRRYDAVVVELNSTDTSALMEIRGIGPYFANRIVAYRDALGGYHSIDQLLEIYRMDTATLDRLAPHFVLDPAAVDQIDINQIALDSLRRHPYFAYSLANSLVQIRKMHGPYRRPEDLMRSHLMNDSIFTRIKPYIVIHD